MKNSIIFVFLLHGIAALSQETNHKEPLVNVRLSFLVFPPITPLLTLELRTINKLTVQLETNFVNTHGVNLKYFTKQTMNQDYLFIGSAFVESDYLRKDLKTTFIPYLGYGYVYRFGKNNDWIVDSRIGLGQTLNADSKIFLPIIKTGVGKTF